ncbi:MAG: pantoate--beta-alanine ligase [Actinomycetota bacterium]
MRVFQSIGEFRAALVADRAAGRFPGLVPTMGYLHDGHASLIRAARSQCDVVAVSIFVNPLQFGPAEDLAAYPRDMDRDLAVCEAEGADYVLAPGVEEMYPEPAPVRVSAGRLGEVLCGASRPGHFDGVATVVAKLFNIAGPCRAYFGRKDAQQLVVIRQMARALDFPVEVVGCPTVREAGGVAMSSRNVYLSDGERGAAAVLYKALVEASGLVESGERDGARIAALMGERISSEPLTRPDYAACVDPAALEDVARIEGPVLLAVAAWFGGARLIDNTTATPRYGAPSGG